MLPARAAALAEAEHEYRRLLYVAMTRAADRLIVCGADGVKGRPAGCWYNLVRDALEPLLVAEGENDEKVLRFRKRAAERCGAAAPPKRQWARPIAVSAFMASAACGARTAAAGTISPSSAFDEEIAGALRSRAPPPDRQKALARGRIVHRLMQSLPDIPVAARKSAIERFLRTLPPIFLPPNKAR